MIQLPVAANVGVFVAERFVGDALIRAFALWPPAASAGDIHGPLMPWQPLTYAFQHANGAHLALNMLGLHMFGRDVERTLGALRTWLLYTSSILGAAFAQIICTALGILSVALVIGASGGVFGLLPAYYVLFVPHVMRFVPGAGQISTWWQAQAAPAGTGSVQPVRGFSGRLRPVRYGAHRPSTMSRSVRSCWSAADLRFRQDANQPGERLLHRRIAGGRQA